jgi:hypothetical protein
MYRFAEPFFPHAEPLSPPGLSDTHLIILFCSPQKKTVDSRTDLLLIGVYSASYLSLATCVELFYRVAITYIKIRLVLETMYGNRINKLVRRQTLVIAAAIFILNRMTLMFTLRGMPK